MVIARECAQSPDCLYRLHATYEAPWEEVAYGIGDGGYVYFTAGLVSIFFLGMALLTKGISIGSASFMT